MHDLSHAGQIISRRHSQGEQKFADETQNYSVIFVPAERTWVARRELSLRYLPRSIWGTGARLTKYDQTPQSRASDVMWMFVASLIPLLVLAVFPAPGPKGEMRVTRASHCQRVVGGVRGVARLIDLVYKNVANDPTPPGHMKQAARRNETRGRNFARKTIVYPHALSRSSESHSDCG